MKVAFYIGTRPGIAGLYNRLVRWWENGTSSHVELVFSDGISASASLADEGVRFKYIQFNPANWVFIDLGNLFDEDYARKWFISRIKERAKYDWFGQLRFFIAPYQGSANRYWCSEAVGAALQLRDPWRYGPNPLRIVIEEMTAPHRARFFVASQGKR